MNFSIASKVIGTHNKMVIKSQVKNRLRPEATVGVSSDSHESLFFTLTAAMTAEVLA